MQTTKKGDKINSAIVDNMMSIIRFTSLYINIRC